MKRQRIFNHINKVSLKNYLNGQVIRFKDTRIILHERPEFVKLKTPGNVLELITVQEGEELPLVQTKKANRTFGGKSISISYVALSDEALEAMYYMLKERFEAPMIQRLEPYNIVELKQKIENHLAKGLDDNQLSIALNNWQLPWEQYQIAIEYYKHIEQKPHDTN